jgi:hypothetical protein
LSNVTILFRDVDQNVQVKAHHALVASITSTYGAVIDLFITWVLIILALDYRIRLQVGVIVIHAHSIWWQGLFSFDFLAMHLNQEAVVLKIVISHSKIG